MPLDKITLALTRLEEPSGEARKLLFLLARDARGAAISYELFATAARRLRSVARAKAPTSETLGSHLMDAAIYHASCFVCAVRRFARVLEAMAASRAFNQAAAEAIRLVWRSRRAFFADYVTAHKAIEHSDEAAKDLSTLDLYSLMGSELLVSTGQRARVDDKSLAKVIQSLDSVVDAIISHSERAR